MLNVPASADSFISVASFNAVKSLLKTYAASTSEDYIWRLHRFLSNSPGFPKERLQKYGELLAKYKKLYS